MIAALTTGASHRTPLDKTDQLDLTRAPPAGSLPSLVSCLLFISCQSRLLLSPAR